MSFLMTNPLLGTPEVSSARNKLDGVLQTLVEKKDESPVPSDDENAGIGILQDILKDTSSPAASPKKAVSKSAAKKRKRKDDLSATQVHYHHTYVMKLFDRSVDLAQFEDETPLYPICRAWMRNQPLNRSLAPGRRPRSPEHRINTDSEEDRDKPKDIYKLPDAIPIQRDKYRLYEDLRVPDPIKQNADPLNIHADQDSAPAPEQLLLNNMRHWKEVRQSWKDSSAKNEVRYKKTTKLLREMFDRQMKEN